MDFELSAEDRDFQSEVRARIREDLPAELAAKIARGYYASREDIRFWMGKLHARGWSAPHWPEEYGGTGWSPLWRHIFEEELWMANAPQRPTSNVFLVGPVIYTYGSEKQKRRFLEPMLDGSEMWCQGFSEPNAGSDLASLTTRAVRDGDDYVINGQKIWNSRADVADWSFTLVRTDPDVPKQRGISMILVPMNTPGITVRPIRTLTGENFLAETFYENVRVPAENLVGEPNLGWTYAKSVLTQERSSSAEVPSSKRDLAYLKTLAAQPRGKRPPLLANAGFRRRIAQAEIDLIALETSVLRVLSDRDQIQSLPVASLLKVRGSEMRQRLSELMVETLGEYGMIYYPDPAEHDTSSYPPGPNVAPGLMHSFLHRRATTIYGGTNEVQRNIIARNILSL